MPETDTNLTWTNLHLVMQVGGSSKANFQGMNNAEQGYKGIIDCFRKTYRESGSKGLYRGAGMHVRSYCSGSCCLICLNDKVAYFAKIMNEHCYQHHHCVGSFPMLV